MRKKEPEKKKTKNEKSLIAAGQLIVTFAATDLIVAVTKRRYNNDL